MKYQVPPSLNQLVKTMTVRWSLFCLVLSTFIASTLVFYIGLSNSRKQIQNISLAVSKAYRPMIIEGRIVEVEAQLRDIFKLEDHESIVVRDKNFELYYKRSKSNVPIHLNQPTCKSTDKTCWNLLGNQMSILSPIYFDSEKKELFGYVEVNLKPKFDVELLLFLFSVIMLGFVAQSIGFASRFVTLTKEIASRLLRWAEFIKLNPKASFKESEVPLQELKPMQEALSGLSAEIEKLEKEAVSSAQITLIRGFAHDILSPVSQITKFTSVLLHSVENDKAVDPAVTQGMKRSLDRLVSLARQAKAMHLEEPNSEKRSNIDACNLTEQLKQMVEDLRQDQEVLENNLSFELLAKENYHVQIPAEACHRIFDNLIRNAIHASPANGRISLEITTERSHLVVKISDQGHGIPESIVNRIFDLDFTTKPGRGTGLGLPIVKELCEKHKADISFSSNSEVGTEFRVQIANTGVLI